ncbi:restriction endonuclease subunit S [Vibrio alginolyticus]|uniref:restriction endonuclease subunit S n=1 Tax=Vibrio alginolyticus TaxID=663 RepID=UPI001BD240B8|nr:restriction endonuclease subunit S [Vibrio alginolyticus]MBS9819811.1 restriction endonuclease subunit S [Vibrio alginolyticus]
MSNLVPNGWRRVQLGDVVEPRSSNVDKKTHEGEIPVQLCNYTDVYYNNRITSRVSFMDATAKEREIERFTLAVDDVIITKDSETPNDIAVPAYVSEDLRGVVCGYHLTILRPYQGKSNGEYLAHLFQLPSIQHHFYVLANGITRFGLTADAISNAPLVLPPLSEQKKIAAILTSVDEVIEKTQAQIDKLKDLKTGMMQELLTCGVGVDGKPHMEFKDSPVGRIPKAWEVKSIGDLFQVQLGKMLSKQSKVGDCPLPYLGNKNVQWGKFDLTNIETMDFSEKEILKFSLKRGDLLMCEGGDVGRCAIWNNEIGNCYYQKALHRLRPINNEYDSFLLMEYMKFAKQNGALVDYISQTSIAHLTKEKLVSIPVPVPPREEQRKIVSALKAVTFKLQTGQKKLDKTSALKKALMQDLLTGKVRVKVDS